jgi:hypothetical protein
LFFAGLFCGGGVFWGTGDGVSEGGADAGGGLVDGAAEGGARVGVEAAGERFGGRWHGVAGVRVSRIVFVLQSVCVPFEAGKFSFIN